MRHERSRHERSGVYNDKTIESLAQCVHGQSPEYSLDVLRAMDVEGLLRLLKPVSEEDLNRPLLTRGPRSEDNGKFPKHRNTPRGIL